MSEGNTPTLDEENGQADRLAQPVDAEQPPRLPFPVVGIGASAGGIEAFGEFLDAMRPDAGMAFVFILHLPPTAESHLPDILARRTAMPVVAVDDGMQVEPNHAYVIRPGRVLTIREGRLRLGPELGGPRAANRPIDDFFRSLAAEQRERAICVVLSGMGSNGTAGAQAIKAVGGLCVAQDPESAAYASMPRHLIDAGYADYIARPTDLPDILLTYAGSGYATGEREADARVVLEREQRHLREILAILRTRSRQDFTGYRKPTLLRRVQRRMGLTRLPTLIEYARHLRQSPTEVTALADDLLIHVTGFFRDPDAWDKLYERVIVPLVEAREAGTAIRAWVSACSSGEEAYSLAMLLVEASERAGKRLDIKVFATDLADRTLAHARAGVYPGGIESEIGPERLARFFAREDEVYRVRQDLRDRVVFAPQNILQDPPFSQLDIACCRNLLIYLEPQVQQRVLSLLHFGLREGGALFLGTSETVTGAEDLYEPVDKKARIFRRVGPTRHGTLDFPLPRPFRPDDARDAAPAAEARPTISRAGPTGLAELTRQALLNYHTPPAVTVDRDGQILYYHGDTRPFLQQLSGEPTRDLLLLAKDGVRAAARIALHKAATTNAPAAVPDGWVDLDAGRRCRVQVAASPVGNAPADYYVVSFERREEIPPPSTGPGETATSDELRRLRGELQSTIEELQTSNEELKASNEEVMSINEELQSSNEELETSKEEMQSLNEELRTLNAQLRAKMEEHQAAASDLASLLASTDIAVLFLDPQFRIRRFTPAVRDLLDLIPGDVGRPLSALARRFDDPALDDDCRAVLEKLVPFAREVAAASGRYYLRRTLPYRTMDNRIDGVVVTLVDITERKAVEQALEAEKEYAESIVETLHEPLLVLKPDLTVRSVNSAFYSHFQVNPAETVGRKIYHLGNGQWDIPALRTLLEDVLPANNVFNDYEVWHDFEGLGPRIMLMNGRRLDHVQLILLGVRDITDQRRAEDALRESEARQAFLLTLSDAIGPLGSAEEIEVTAARVLGQYLGPSRVAYAEDCGDGQHFVVTRSYVDRAPEATGRFRYADYGTRILADLQAGKTCAQPDIQKDPQLSEPEKQALAAYGIGASLNVPLVKGGRLVAFLGVNYPAAHEFQPHEIDLVQEVAERTWAAVERAQAEAALATELDAMTRLRDLSDRLLATADLPAALGEVLDTATALHKADRGTVQVYQAMEDKLHYAAVRGFDSAALATVPAVNRNFHSTCAEALRTGKPVVAVDISSDPRFVEHAPTAELLDYRAAFSFPLTTRQGEFLGVLSVHFTQPREPSERELRWAAVYAPLAAHLIERHQAEAALRQSEERLRLALAAARMGTWSLDLQTGEQARDANLNRLLGLEPVDSTQPFAEFLEHIHPEDRSAVEAAFAASDREGRTLGIEFRVVWPDGTIRWLRDQGGVFDGPAGARRMTGACVDVTDRHLAEEAVRVSEERLRLILESATDYAIFTLTPDRTVTAWSPGATATFGWSADEMVGQSMDVIFTPEDRAAGEPEKEAEEARSDGRAGDERWHMRSDGTRFYASGVLTPLGNGGSHGFVKVLRDLTDRKRTEDELRRARDELETRVAERTSELRQSQDQALRAERLAAIGQTVTALAHEGRNALQRAVGSLARLGMRLQGRVEELGLLDRSRLALDDLEHLFDDIRTYAAPIQLDLRTCDLGTLWREVWADVVAQHPGRDARLNESGSSELTCEADPFRLRQVFTNLFTNVLEACPDPVLVEIAWREASAGGRPTLQIVLRDNGPGFTEDQRRRALEPFFTTKARGTGLGLAIARRILEAHGGSIALNNANTGGAEFTLTLPRAREQALEG